MVQYFKWLHLAIVLVTASQFSFGQATSDSTKTKKAVRFAAIPLINYNRTQGIILGASTSAFYQANKKDTISPASTTGLMGIYTAEDTWFIGLSQQFYLKRDLWRLRGFLGVGNVNYQYFDGDVENDIGQYEDYSNESVIVVGQVQRNIWRRIYGGLYVQFNNTKTTFESEGTVDERNMNNIGYIFTNDSRNDVYFPTKGIFMNFKNQFYREWIGTDNDFVRYQLNYTQFFDLKKDSRHILLGRINLNVATGDVPFQGQAVVGRDDIRGYSQGKYRGDQVYAVQSEYRWRFDQSKFGMVGFLGVASAVESFSDVFDSQILPGGGAGLRYRLIPSMNVNIGVDVGFGKDDYSLTFRIGETFGR
ncbi:MAG TPA: BamA/TamA family outer membrane protein [Flavobacterium sp.]|uniref:BamA/TamA family outer membrane protein n=1 Tax=Flavobacterium sp. TaxID=239 RepID=UPI002C6BC2D9|nr:BamA/TamA family outer membrane protein [Flavobacterium sp.]HSD14906.1 BamA/TamA family outer membrane protein [Flavobacterium sp.]